MARVWEEFLTQEDREVARRRNLRVPHGPGRKTALLVIDMQVTAIGEDRPIHEQLERYPGACGPHAWAAIPVQQRLLAAARAAGMPVIYSKHVFHPHTGLAKSAAGVFAASDPRSEIQAEVAMQPGDILLEKQTPSCFTFTNLHMILSELGVDGLLTVGNSTSGCVRASCVEGEAMGYKMMVVEEGVFDRIQMSHAAALFDMQFKICDVIDEAAAMAIIAGPDAVQKSA
ncbi:isochorismatase family protein [Pseudooceanicola spongiae]|jgi:maleamate amidohydrolase|uniref:Isochorismatase family protein n=1 Tax=Pseudooceanicola spongiae TaxID=2613965 RepID=A0A7L9WLG0_9RHOB|nr:isochorismatase family protein [Pseudooceanicola spongiae]QOL79890.1 isochorismatase family protein [Pseudooceanicola spongiae]